MTSSDTQKRKGMSKLRVKEAVQGYLFLVPTLVLFTVFSLVTVLMGIIYAFTDMAPGSPESFHWTFANFQYIFQDKMYLHSILNVFIFALMSVPLTVVSSLLVAALLNREMKGIKVFRVLYYLPAVTSGIATAYIWKWLYNDSYGLFNTVIQAFGGQGIKWVTAQNYFAMFCVAIVSAWTGLGGNMLVYLAGMRSISPELYEAAELDGANGFQKLIYITVPLLNPTTYFIMTMSLIGAFQLYDVVAMIGAGDNYYTQTPIMQITGAFRHGEGGMASAMSVVLFVVIMIVTFITQGLVKEKNNGK